MYRMSFSKFLSHDVYEQRAESADLLQHRAGIQHPPSKWSLICPLLISHQSPPSKVFRSNLEPTCHFATAVYVSQMLAQKHGWVFREGKAYDCFSVSSGVMACL